MHPICLCFSTGRSGTTFLAHTLTATYHPEVDVFHEDISEFQSNPRCYLWSLDERDFAPMRKNPIIAAHLARVQERSALRPYVDVGHTVTPLVSLLLATFPGRLRLLHLVRDPVEASASMAVRGMYHPRYEGMEGPAYNLPPDPCQTRCAHPEYASRWQVMTPFEKNLWRWGEYHLLAMAIHERNPEVPYLRLPSENLFKDQSCSRIIADFFGLPKRDIVAQPTYRNETHPNLTSSISIGDEWRRYVEYAYILDLATLLGVPVQQDGLDKKMKKYAAPTAWQIAKYRWKVRLTPQWWARKLRQVGVMPHPERKRVG